MQGSKQRAGCSPLIACRVMVVPGGLTPNAGGDRPHTTYAWGEKKRLARLASQSRSWGRVGWGGEPAWVLLVKLTQQCCSLFLHSKQSSLHSSALHDQKVHVWQRWDRQCGQTRLSLSCWLASVTTFFCMLQQSCERLGLLLVRRLCIHWKDQEVVRSFQVDSQMPANGMELMA